MNTEEGAPAYQFSSLSQHSPLTGIRRVHKQRLYWSLAIRISQGQASHRSMAWIRFFRLNLHNLSWSHDTLSKRSQKLESGCCSVRHTLCHCSFHIPIMVTAVNIGASFVVFRDESFTMAAFACPVMPRSLDQVTGFLVSWDVPLSMTAFARPIVAAFINQETPLFDVYDFDWHFQIPGCH